MRIFLAILLFVAAGSYIAYDYYDVNYWLTPPEKRLSQKWSSEVARVMSRSKKISKELQLLKETDTTLTDPQFTDMIEKTKRPFTTTPKGVYRLHIELIPSIEDMKYGFVIQHEIFDTRDNNKVDEFNLDVPIGRLW